MKETPLCCNSLCPSRRLGRSPDGATSFRPATRVHLQQSHEGFHAYSMLIDAYQITYLTYQCLMCLPQFYPQALPKNQFAPFSFLRTRIFILYWLTWLTPVFDVVAVCFADQASISLPKSFWSNNGKRWWDLSRVLRLNWCYWLRRIGCVTSCDFVWLRVTLWFCGFIHSVSQGFARFRKVLVPCLVIFVRHWLFFLADFQTIQNSGLQTYEDLVEVVRAELQKRAGQNCQRDNCDLWLALTVLQCLSSLSYLKISIFLFERSNNTRWAVFGARSETRSDHLRWVARLDRIKNGGVHTHTPHIPKGWFRRLFDELALEQVLGRCLHYGCIWHDCSTSKGQCLYMWNCHSVHCQLLGPSVHVKKWIQ